MAIVNPIPSDRAPADARPVDEDRAIVREGTVDAKEKAVILFADRMTRSAAVMRDPALEDARRHFTNRFNDGLRIEPDLG